MLRQSAASTLGHSTIQSLQSSNTMTQLEEGVTTGKSLVPACDPRNRRAVTRTVFFFFQLFGHQHKQKNQNIRSQFPVIRIF